MTPEERAEKICDRLCSRGLDGGEFHFVLAEIWAALEEANLAKNQWTVTVAEEIIQRRVKEAVEEASVLLLPVERESILGRELLNRAKAEAYEDAAKIAEMYLIHDPDDGQHGGFIANAIRARAAEVSHGS